MQRSVLSRYWVFQLVGWGIFAVLNIFFALVFSRYNNILLERVTFSILMGLLFSHLMREVIRKSELLLKSLKQQIIVFTILTLLFGLLIASCIAPYEYFRGLRASPSGRPVPYVDILFNNLVAFFILLLIWNFIYFMYHYIAKSRKQQMDTLQLEALVKELELKTIKAHINPHFIFNALNGIRALIDENPVRARRAVTELSNILRSSLNVEKTETVSLGDELRIVKDYLALENMRFEDRLRIEYEIDEETLEQQVPPMMLQTLVENAIKHGISKQVKGGVVKIISDMHDNFHELSVQNTGFLNGHSKKNGFGLSSTQDRLNLLYGDKAKFEIRQLNTDLVEAKVSIPFH